MVRPHTSRMVTLLLCAGLLACSDDDRAAEAQNDVDSGTYRNKAGAECCIPSPMPACAMSFGGAKNHLGICASAIDGMPRPADPAWRLVNDRFGCPTWISTGSKGPCCGSPPADAGSDVVYSCYPDPIKVEE